VTVQPLTHPLCVGMQIEPSAEADAHPTGHRALNLANMTKVPQNSILSLFSRHVACLLLQTLELDPGNTVSVAKVARLEPVVAERREKMKDEMIGAAACFATCKP
jgi:hypothetical protein